MKRIETSQINADVLRQARNIRTWAAGGIGLMITAVVLFFFSFPETTQGQWMTAVGLFSFGFAVLGINVWMMGRMPEAETRRVYEQPYDTRRAEAVFNPVTAHQLRRPNHGLNAREWRLLCAAVAGNEWRMNRDTLIRAGLQDMTAYVSPNTTKYKQVRESLIAAGMLGHDGVVPEHARRLYLASLPQSADIAHTGGL